MMLDFDLELLGFTEDDIAEIQGNFEYRLELEDWESIALFENDAEFLLYLVKDHDKESLIVTLLEMSAVNGSNLEDNQSVLEYQVEGNKTIFKLSNGRWAVFSEELIHKDELQQI
ncbi:hypothetical protein COM23_21000 [Bacillus wiedmannii]|uniref:hypothetical protein n=1 Tax=Bacillus wiedmannii TaxID=1890302 RepID=UPI000BF8519E|nr:hypothetical protein [Bacillus wiedmannii]PGC22778.1 hypothetical protein COM23_21000 [Bacillus wiedmannii]